MATSRKQNGLDPLDFYNETAAARVGRRIKEIRTEKNMTQAELGDAVGLSADRIQQYENGYRRPRADLLKNMANVLGVSSLSLVDPTTTSLIGSMYAFFELEELFNMRIEEGPGDKSSTLCLSVSDRDELYPYMKEWLAVKKQVSAHLDAAASDQEREKITQAYHHWKWSYPQSSLDLDDVSQAKENLLKRIRALQEAYDKLS